jgi:hypothetical protein
MEIESLYETNTNKIMKNTFLRIVVFVVTGAVCSLSSCSKSDPAPAAPEVLSASTIQGNWTVTTAEGTEWKKGTGISTPRANDPGTLGIILTISATSVIAKQGSNVLGTFTYTLDVAKSTILIGPDGNNGVGFFTISAFVAGKGMKMDAREPIDADYSLKTGAGTCNCSLYFQKFWTLTKS